MRTGWPKSSGAPCGAWYVYWSVSSVDKKGLCDVYGADGFEGTQTWTDHEVSGSGGVGAASWADCWEPNDQ